MAFGATYELAIVLFVVVFGLLFLVLDWTFLYQPFLELTIFFGIFVFLYGFAKKSYDTVFSGILLMIVALAMLAARPGIAPTAPGMSTVLNVTWPITTLMTTFYSLGPIPLALFILLLAWILSRS
ncbi:MAG: hypothetical protein PWP76_318 [Candidatus Diapherotrites archaeon]|nr:hypothetical protein [Candidatus Diapherotrites archaeon]MDN5366688.1 hypothetical protein [Candidatus Diapherotrites archaeon]